jgi:hypothetical protein
MCATTPLVTGETSKCVKHSRYDVFQTHFSFHLFEEFVLGHAHTPTLFLLKVVEGARV